MREAHILGQQRVRADDDLDLAVGEFGLDLLRLLGGDHARELRDAHRQPGEALAETAEVLARQQRGRHDRPRPGRRRTRRRRRRAAPPRSCRSRHRRRSAGPSACPTPCRPASPRSRAAGPRSRDTESARRIPRRSPRAAPRFARLQLALGGDADQFAGDLADALLDARLARLPADPAEPVELRPAFLRAVARQHLDILDRHEELVVAGIDHLQAIVRRAGDSSVSSPS